MHNLQMVYFFIQYQLQFLFYFLVIFTHDFADHILTWKI